jgi:VanZ family protein
VGECRRQEGGVLTGVFTSTRERSLWGAAGAVVLAIWATLGLAGRLAAQLEPTGWPAAAFGLAFLCAIVAVVGHGVSARPSRRQLWATAGIIAVYAMVVVRLGVVERTHLFEYGIVAVLMHTALLERQAGGRGPRWPAASAVLLAAGLGWIDEGIQAFLPFRVYDLRDVGFNALAAAMAVLATVVLRWARGRVGPAVTEEDDPDAAALGG